MLLLCVADGHWSGWSVWSLCSVTCGGGNKTRNRTCTDPEPKYGGENCTGNELDNTSCNTDPCPGMLKWCIELDSKLAKNA